jgi:tRNA-dihydrouridine synthase B
VSLIIGPTRIDAVAVLAPMAGMTDRTFRLLCVEQGCGLVYTELVHARLLVQGERRSRMQAETREGERPVGVQLYGTDPATLAEAARWVEENLPCDLIDLNMGCPVAHVVTRGAGAALMRQPKLVERLVAAVVDAVSVPVTAKTRSGWDDGEISAPDVARAVEAAGGAAIAVHARTRAQKHEGPVDWDLLAEIKGCVGIPVIGNGGITEPAHALRMREVTGVDAVMIGRGALGNPWIFRAIEDAWHDRPTAPVSLEERLAMVERHLRGSVETFLDWAKKQKDFGEAEGRGVRYVRGHLVRYAAGAPGERAFKQRLNSFRTPEEALQAVAEAWADPGTGGSGPTLTDRDAAA